MVSTEKKLYKVPQNGDKNSSMSFQSGFSRENPNPIFEEVRQGIGSYLQVMTEAEKLFLPEDKRHTPDQLIGAATGHTRRAEGLWHVHRKSYERDLIELQNSGALDFRKARVGEVGLNLGLHLLISSIVPAEVDGVDIDASAVGFANELFRRKGLEDRFRAHYGGTDFQFAENPDLIYARIVTQYAGLGILDLGRQARIASFFCLTHTKSDVDSAFLTKEGKLNKGAEIPIGSKKSPDLKSGLAYRIAGEGVELFPNMTLYPKGEIVYDPGMYNLKNGLVMKHRAGNEYQTPFVLIEQDEKLSIVPWCIEPLDMKDKELTKMIAGVTLLTRDLFDLQGFDSNANTYLGGLVAEDPSLRAVVSYSAGGENGASNMTVAGLFKVFKDTINGFFKGGRLGHLVGEGKPFETIDELNDLIDHPEVWTGRAKMHAPLETGFDIFTDRKDRSFGLLATY